MSQGDARECQRCSGAMHRGIVPCTYPEHGQSCTRVHMGYQCEFCGAIEDEHAQRQGENSPGRRKLFEGER